MTIESFDFEQLLLVVRRAGLSLTLWALVGFGFLTLRADALPVHAQETDPTAVIQHFFDAINRGDAAGAAAVFSDAGAFKGNAACPNTCRTRSQMAELAFGPNWVSTVPWTFAVERQCGDTVAVLAQNNQRAEANQFAAVTFRILGGEILSAEVLSPPYLHLDEARAAAAKACGVYSPAPPGPFNHGGVLSVDTRLTIWLGAVLLGTVATVLLALLLHIGRRLKWPA